MGHRIWLVVVLTAAVLAPSAARADEWIAGDVHIDWVTGPTKDPDPSGTTWTLFYYAINGTIPRNV